LIRYWRIARVLSRGQRGDHVFADRGDNFKMADGASTDTLPCRRFRCANDWLPNGLPVEGPRTISTPTAGGRLRNNSRSNITTPNRMLAAVPDGLQTSGCCGVPQRAGRVMGRGCRCDGPGSLRIRLAIVSCAVITHRSFPQRPCFKTHPLLKRPLGAPWQCFKMPRLMNPRVRIRTS